MEDNPQPSKHCCLSYALTEEYNKQPIPEDCNGILTTGYVNREPDEGYYIEVCPRRSWLGKAAGSAAFCGLGPDMIILHRDTIPTEDEYQHAARMADDDW